MRPALASPQRAGSEAVAANPSFPLALLRSF
jgi:hypothetical protein